MSSAYSVETAHLHKAVRLSLRTAQWAKYPNLMCLLILFIHVVGLTIMQASSDDSLVFITQSHQSLSCLHTKRRDVVKDLGRILDF